VINGKMTPGSDEEYARLTAELPPRPIRTADEAGVVEARIADLMSLKAISDAQRDYLDVLSDQLADWEDSNEEIPDVAGVELVRFLLDEQGLRQKDLVTIFGTESIASEVLSGRRELQRKHIEALSKFFNVSPSAFFPGSGSEAASSAASNRRVASAVSVESKGEPARAVSEARRISIVFDAWATAAVDYARRVMPMDIILIDPALSTSEKAKTAKRENAVLYTVRTATASVLRLTEIGQIVFLASKEFGASTQTKLFEKVSIFLLGQHQSAAGLPSHERIVVDRDHMDLERFNSGSIIHTETIPLALETA
jgi:HTH-type transcriptional regulator / antitoxin HigA